MVGYVAKERVREILLKLCDDPEIANWQPAAVLHAVYEEVAKLPPADVVKVRRGQWLLRLGTGEGWRECSVCGARWKLAPIYVKRNFCNNCGAKMDGEEAQP